MAQWNRVSLIDYIELIGGGTPKTTVPEYWNGNIPWLSVKDFNNDKRYVYSTEKHISQSGFENSPTKVLHKDDIIISTRGTVGEIAMIPFDMAFNQSCYGIRASRGIDQPFLYYLLKNCISQLKRMTHGSVFDTITRDTFANIEVDIPDAETQKRISSVLADIDNKIEVNDAINDNLRQQAQALFKKWFVDNPDAILWKEGTFSNLIEKTISGDWGKDSPSGNNTEMVYCIRGADIPEVRAGNKGKMPTRYILPKNYAAKQLVDGDIVVEISGGSPTQSTGRAAAVSDALLARYDKGMVCTNFCKALKPRAGYSMYVYYYWQYLYDRDIFFSYENGTTGIKNLDINGFIETEPIVIAPEDLVEKFDAVCQTVFSKIYANGMENEQLALVRDTILPKIMSGEIDVSAVQL